MSAYYNEYDPFAAAWLRELIAEGLIAPGEVDERSILDVAPEDLRGFIQCHFFAGIGVWSLALRLAGWEDNRAVWSGSCPCQPFSQAGEGAGFDDERHLWPAFEWLIRYGKPDAVPVFGEQVASKDGLSWIDLVSADMEGQGYALGAVDTCAAGFGAPHIRSRFFWVADAECERVRGPRSSSAGRAAARMQGAHRKREWVRPDFGPIRASVASALAYADDEGCQRRRGGSPFPGPGKIKRLKRCGDARPVAGHWKDAEWIFCRDGRWRPIEPGSFPLAYAGDFRQRVGLLRGSGNAITIGQAQAFIEAVMECRP